MKRVQCMCGCSVCDRRGGLSAGGRQLGAGHRRHRRTYYPFGGAMAKIWNSKIKDMNVTAQTSGASARTCG